MVKPFIFRKYIRDCERLHLASQALAYCIDALDADVRDTEKNLEQGESLVSLVMEVYKIWQHGSKADRHSKQRIDHLFEKVYRLHRGGQVCVVFRTLCFQLMLPNVDILTCFLAKLFELMSVYMLQHRIEI